MTNKNSLPRVDILLKGYYSLGETTGRACATITLIEDKDLRIVVDQDHSQVGKIRQRICEVAVSAAEIEAIAFFDAGGADDLFGCPVDLWIQHAPGSARRGLRERLRTMSKTDD